MAEERVTRAVGYVEGQETSEMVSRAVSYLELTIAQEQVTRAVSYLELTEESIRVSRVVVYFEVIEEAVDPKPSHNREPAFYATVDHPNFSTLLTPPFDLRPVRWSWTRPGGCDRAEIEVMGDERDVFQMLPGLLRAPVTIFNNNHSKCWWGFVNELALFAGNTVIGFSLDGMYNKIAVSYNQLAAGGTSGTPTTTAWAQSDESIDRFGTKELLSSYGDATTTQAEAVRDGLLAAFSSVLPDVRPGRSGVVAKLTCRGWWQTLGWKYYANSGTSAVDIHDQLDAIITDAGQFLTGFDAIHEHLIASNEYRDGSQTALEIVEELLQVPASGARMTAWVNSERLVKFDYEGSSGGGDWLLLPDHSFRTPLSGIPEAGREVIGWTRLRNVLPTDSWGYMVSPTPFYIEENEFEAAALKYSWRGRGAVSPWL